MIVYLFTFPNGKHYVGRTKNSLEQRCIEHKCCIGKKQHPLYHAFSKYGWENVKKEILDSAENHDELVIKELFYINKYNSFHKGYNLTLNTEIGGDNWIGKKDTEEFKEWKKRISLKLIGENNIMFGKQHDEVSKNKMKEKAKGRFSLNWFQEKYGLQEGKEKYEERNQKLKNRDYSKMKDPLTGTFRKRGE